MTMIRFSMFLFSLGLFGILTSLSSSYSLASTVTIQEDAVEINGTKFWFPSTIIAKKGDTIKIHAVSKIGKEGDPSNVHGFAIDQFKVSEVVDIKGKDIEFK